MTALPPLHVKVEFGRDIPNAAQRSTLLAFEKLLRNSTGLDIQVFKDAKGDDSKLRSLMTAEQRAKL